MGPKSVWSLDLDAICNPLDLILCRSWRFVSMRGSSATLTKGSSALEGSAHAWIQGSEGNVRLTVNSDIVNRTELEGFSLSHSFRWESFQARNFCAIM